MNKFIKKYKPFTRSGMLGLIAFRANFICFLIGESLYCFIMYYVWRAVMESSPNPTFMGFTMQDMVLYLFITFLSGYFTYSSSSGAIGEEITDGSIAMRMIKPISYDISFLFQEIGEKIILLSLVFVPIVVGVECYRYYVTGAIQFSPYTFLLYIISLIFAYLVSFYFNICYGFLAFFLKNLWGSNVLKSVIVSFLSGATIPLAFLPLGLRNVLQFLPFASLSYTPVMIYMGKYQGAQLLISFGLQIFWVFCMWAISRLIWRAAIKRLSVQGG
ncbi:MAG: ABC-2 family transporter protein [Bacillota bacterium]|nr:ABC-2 family transporter protein [Bacillota bacterium]